MNITNNIKIDNIEKIISNKNLESISLEKLVKSKLEHFFYQQEKSQIEIKGLYDIVIEQVEKPLIELTLKATRGNKVKSAKILGINRNTLKKKIDTYKIKYQKILN